MCVYVASSRLCHEWHNKGQMSHRKYAKYARQCLPVSDFLSGSAGGRHRRHRRRRRLTIDSDLRLSCRDAVCVWCAPQGLAVVNQMRGSRSRSLVQTRKLIKFMLISRLWHAALIMGEHMACYVYTAQMKLKSIGSSQICIMAD